MDTIIINGFEYFTSTYPMEQFWKKNPKPSFNRLLTPLWIRPYHAAWKIENLEMFLVDFHGWKDIPPPRKEYFLEDIFPKVKRKISAEWFSGELIIYAGKYIPSNEIDIPGSWEYYSTIKVEKGFVIDSGVFDL